MKNHHLISISLIALAALTGCSSLPPGQTPLELARSDYVAAQNNRQTTELAASELRDAGIALQRANDAAARNENSATVDHLSYLARQRVAIAEEVGKQKSAEMTVTNANAVRDNIQLAARTKEADAARQSVDVAQRESEMAKKQAREAQLRNSQLEAQIRYLNAKQTERGLVITIGDVLFDTNRAQLKGGASRSLEKLVNFLNQYPQRKVLIEGFTDSTGSEASNLALSSRRSNAVRMALIVMGINSTRITTQGHGESYPVADNGTASGRQLNRRVEIIVSDDSGQIAPR
jgi:outer membrane protein OmpA-like peptidoglycan-associated protein